MTTDRRLLVLDDDPTGSQCVAGVDVVLGPDAALAAAALAEPGSTCFVLTNSRALEEAEAAGLAAELVDGVIAAGVDPASLHVVSRSDSTLRGHVIAEPAAIAAALAHHGREVDGILLVPAMIEAGRTTTHGTHHALVQGERLPVAQTDFARDATFGYTRSDLPGFLEERSGGAVPAPEVLRVDLEDIRSGGADRVEEILGAARGGRWIAVDAEEYADLEVVAEAVTRLEASGRTLLTRCAPSFVRPLAGQRGARVLTAEDLEVPVNRAGHGLVVVGSHVGLTTRQLGVLQERGGHAEVELSVPALLDPLTRGTHLREALEAVRAALREQDVVLSTSRDLVRGEDGADSLAIARSVSDAVVELVAALRADRPSWVVAKGGITSHEVAASGLGIRRAEVAGQFFPGQISLFTPHEAPPEVLGMPYVVFPGNVGGDDALAEVVERLRVATPASSTPTSTTTDGARHA